MDKDHQVLTGLRRTGRPLQAVCDTTVKDELTDEDEAVTAAADTGTLPLCYRDEASRMTWLLLYNMLLPTNSNTSSMILNSLIRSASVGWLEVTDTVRVVRTEINEH